MVYGIGAVLPVQIETLTLRTIVYDDDANMEAMDGELDLLEEKRLDSPTTRCLPIEDSIVL